MSKVTFTEAHLKANSLSLLKSERKSLVEEVANDLMARDGNITTLFLKNELRVKYPALLWNQYGNGFIEGVSDLFHELVREGKFVSVADNGTYQTYEPVNYRKQTNQLSKALKQASRTSTTAFTTNSGNTTVSTGTTPVQTIGGHRGLVKGSPTALKAGAKAAATRAANKAKGTTVTKAVSVTPETAKKGDIVRVGMAKAKDIILESKGIISVTYTKKDGSIRTLAGVVVKDQKEIGLGYILMKDLVKTKAEGKEVIRRANVQTLISAKANGITYKVR